MNRYGQRNTKPRAVPKKLLIFFALLLVIGLAEFTVIMWKLASDDATTSNTTGLSTDVNPPAAETFDKSKYSIKKASSIWVVVNKGRSLPTNYVPANLETPSVSLRFSAASDEMHLRRDAANALESMFATAAKGNIYLRLASGYRSYYSQSNIYNREVRTYGQTQADRQSARPGHSEHQTGLAADLAPRDGRCEIADCFANTAEGKWLARNDHKYGFILRYPSGKEDLTGYKYEPWHFRYVGKELAVEIKKAGQTLEQFFGLSTNASYPTEIYKLR